MLAVTNHSPFGVTLSGRNFTLTGAEKGRFGFQGQENDNEIKGEGNSVNYTYRMHDPRLGRFFAVDPLAHKYAYYSPYQFSGNCVIVFKELEGCESGIIFPSTGEFNVLKTNEQTITDNWRAFDAHNWADMTAELKALKSSDTELDIKYVYIQTHGSTAGLVIGPKHNATEETKAEFKVTDKFGTSLTLWDLEQYEFLLKRGSSEKYKKWNKGTTFSETELGKKTDRTYDSWADNEGVFLAQFFGLLSELPDNTTVILGACTFGVAEDCLEKLYTITGSRLNFVANKSVTSPPGDNIMDTELTSCGTTQGWVQIGPKTGGVVQNITGDATEGFIKLNSSGAEPTTTLNTSRPCE